MATDHDCHALAEQFLMERYTLDKVRVVHYFQDRYWVWQGRRYVKQPPEYLGDQLLLWLKHARKIGVKTVWEWTQKNMEAILRTTGPSKLNVWLDARSTEESSDEWLAVQNGILNLSRLFRTGDVELVPPSARWFCETVIPTDFLKGSTCPLWQACVEDWLLHDQQLVQFLQEFSGYCLLPDTRHDVGLFLEGEGANGKTVYCDTLMRVLGDDNCSAVPLADWRDQFALIETHGKLVNFSMEGEHNVKIPTAKLKSFVTSDRITMQRKYLGGLTTRPTAKLIVAWNRRPKIHDDSDGFWRRILLLPFRRQYKLEERDMSLKLKLQAEAPGILNWCIDGLKRLRANGRLTSSPVINRATESFRLEADPLSAYLKQQLVASNDEFTTNEVLYNDYVQWANDRGHNTVTIEFFMKSLYRVWPSAKPVRRSLQGYRQRGVSGVTLKQEKADVDLHEKTTAGAT